ncbi:hypothetical protein RUND412_011093 [Rhizina undulata]
MAQKCVHKGCEKVFTDPDEDCNYHPGAPIFHEGQKGWQCCKPRVLTFDEFLAIPPCTTGKHSTTAVALAPAQTSGLRDFNLNQKHPEVPAPSSIAGGVETYGQKPLPKVSPSPTPPPEKKEKPLEQDDPNVPVPEGAKCKRLACGQTHPGGPRPETETCEHHPGVPIFHEGSKGYSCCKRRVLEFDQFLRIPGCSTASKHLFLGTPKSAHEEELVTCRTDFYQTYTHVIVSFFAKNVDKERAKIEFRERELELDLPMGGSKRFKATVPLYGPIEPEGSSFTVLTTKVELKLKKADATSWPTLRSDEATSEIIQIGKPATA